MSDNVRKKGFIPEIAIIRLFLIVLVVLYHSCAIHTGNWDPVWGGGVIPAYAWIGKTAYSYMLEAFVFISGYLFGAKYVASPINYKKELIIKTRRLLLPCWFFGIIYCLLFDNSPEIINKAYNVFIGEAHLWFLPMLFLCFVFTMLFDKLKLSAILVIPVLVVLRIVNLYPLPLRVWECLNFLPFFYVAFWAGRKQYRINNHVLWYLAVFFALYAIVFFFSSVFWRDYVYSSETIITKIAKVGNENILKFLYSSFGVCFIWFFAKYIYNRFSINHFAIWLSGYCFGVYIFQEFILKYLYYYSPLVKSFPNYLVPIAGFIITIVSSVALSYLMLKTSIGRRLLG